MSASDRSKALHSAPRERTDGSPHCANAWAAPENAPKQPRSAGAVPAATPLFSVLFAWVTVLVLGVFGCSQLALASEIASKVRAYHRENSLKILDELVELLEIPNVATDEVNIRRNAEHLLNLLENRGVTASLLEAPGSPPAVFGELAAPGAERTVVFYSHYDGQPVDPSKWTSSPWDPTLRKGLEGVEVTASERGDGLDGEWRLFARSASDDKAPIVAMLTALDALGELGIRPSVNLKFFFEGEEEQGSPHLRQMLERHKERLAADLWLFCDGPVHQSRRLQVVFGVRGVMDVQVTTYGPLRPLHSGHYGNWAPNPGAILTHLIAGMRDLDGRILIEDFYAPVKALTTADRAALAAIPSTDQELRHSLAIARSEADNAPLVERILLPALNVKGIEVGKTGAEAKNAIPDTATANLGFRLVPDQTVEGVQKLVEAHLGQEGYTVVHQEPTLDQRRRIPRLVRVQWNHGYRAMRTSLDHPASKALLAVIDDAFPEPALRMPILGGSLPMYLFEEILKTPLIVLPMVNHDNNQHAPNENLRLQNLWDGIELYATVMAELGKTWK